MTPAESTTLLEDLLAAAQVDARKFGPQSVWEVFKEWARFPVDCEFEELTVMMGQDDESGVTYIEMCRVFEDSRLEQDLEVFLRLFCSRPDAPRLARLTEHLEEGESLTQFFGRVEDLPGLRMAFAYPYWEFETGGY